MSASYFKNSATGHACSPLFFSLKEHGNNKREQSLFCVGNKSMTHTYGAYFTRGILLCE
jgi:hypothetical protein